MEREGRLIADVFGLTYREYSEAREAHYKWRIVAPEAVKALGKARDERWSLEKLADHLYATVEEASQSLRRYVMSERVNAGEPGAERIFILFREWLDRFEPDEKERKALARDLSRQLSSQLFLAAQEGQSLEALAQALESPDPEGEKRGEDRPSWGPQWKE